jgi:hypothetical protein
MKITFVTLWVARASYELNVLKTRPVIESVKAWFTGSLVKPLGHWSNRMTKSDQIG